MLFICRLAVLDEWNLLPTGLLMLYAGIHITMEEFAKEAQWQREQAELLQERIRATLFEYHVLRGEPRVKIIERPEGDGSSTIYAI